jgi:hypothetical protein
MISSIAPLPRSPLFFREFADFNALPSTLQTRKPGINLASQLKTEFRQEDAMYAVDLNDLLLTMSMSSFLMGLITFGIGVFILVTRVTGKGMQTVTDQTAQLASKGLAEEIAGLIGNASTLLQTMQEMVRTAAGVGIFLTITGTLLMGGSLTVLLQIH